MRRLHAPSFRSNNFDLLRLFAAAQVVYFHVIENLDVQPPPLLALPTRLLALFPGVPIFFVISGFLISMSYERSPSWRSYALNRFLRIYPALWVCFLVSCAVIGMQVGWSRIAIGADKLAFWIAMQLSIGQFYAPHAIEAAYGGGHPNGSLWTIPVELQFYAVLPFVYLLLRRLAKRAGNLLLLALILLFCGAQLGYEALSAAFARQYEELLDLAHASFVPWFYMFLVGVWLQRNREWLLPILAGRGFYLLGAYTASALAATALLGAEIDNALNPLLFALLALSVVALAFTRPDWSARLLRENDVSYGVYIYHMVIVNALAVAGYGRNPLLLPLVFAITLAVAFLSWRLIERPALRLKRRALRPIAPEQPSVSALRADP